MLFYLPCNVASFASDVKVEKITTLQNRSMDEGAVRGLRGILAFHIMVTHVIIRFFVGGNLFVYIYGAIDMPFFFLLSGFCLALNYGKTHWDRSNLSYSEVKTASSYGIKDLENCDGKQNIFDALGFYKKRLTRIIPLHYLGIIAGCITR